MPTRPTTPSSNLPMRPWPGLAAFEEVEAGTFFGRTAEIAELIRLLHNDAVVLTGKSGLGKTSLLQAGLFPQLQEIGLFPVYVRLHYDPPMTADGFAKQVLDALKETMKSRNIEGHVPDCGPSLWKALFDKTTQFFKDGYLDVQPLFVLDQFEEWFTLGARNFNSDNDRELLLEQLVCLVEGSPPKAVREAIENNPQEMSGFVQTRPGYKVLLSLREDYLAELDELCARMPSLRDSRYLLRPFGRRAASDAILKPAPGLVSRELSEEIVNKLSSTKGAASNRHSSIDPALLCLFCRELNERRIEANGNVFTRELVDTQSDHILRDYYVRSVSQLDSRGRQFIEEELVTSEGYRDSRSYATACSPEALGSGTLGSLVNAHILRSYDGPSGKRVELTHDILAKVVCEVRPARRASEQVKKESDLRNTRILRWAALALFVAGVIIAALIIRNHELENSRKLSELNEQTEKARVETRDEKKKREESEAQKQELELKTKELEVQKKESEEKTELAMREGERANKEADKSKKLADDALKAGIALKKTLEEMSLLQKETQLSRDSLLTQAKKIIDLFVASDDTGLSTNVNLPRRAAVALFPIVEELLKQIDTLGKLNQGGVVLKPVERCRLLRRASNAYFAVGTDSEWSRLLNQAYEVKCTMDMTSDNDEIHYEVARLAIFEADTLTDYGDKDLRKVAASNVANKLDAVKQRISQLPSIVSGDNQMSLLLADVTAKLARMQRHKDDMVAAEKSYLESLKILEGITQKQGADSSKKGTSSTISYGVARLEAEALNGLGNIASEQIIIRRDKGQKAPIELIRQRTNYYQGAYDKRKHLMKQFPNDTKLATDLGISCANLADAQTENALHSNDLQTGSGSLRILELLVERVMTHQTAHSSDTENTEFRVNLGMGKLNLANYLISPLHQHRSDKEKYKGDSPQALVESAMPLVAGNPVAEAFGQTVLQKLKSN